MIEIPHYEIENIQCSPEAEQTTEEMFLGIQIHFSSEKVLESVCEQI